MECHLCGERHLYRNMVNQGHKRSFDRDPFQFFLLLGKSFENNFLLDHKKRQDIREHVLTRHKDQRIYQCQRCEFLTDDLRETMVDHMIGEHDVRHPLCENVDFQEIFKIIGNHKIL